MDSAINNFFLSLYLQNFFLGPYNIETNYGDIALIELDRAAPQTPVPLAPATLNVERLKILTVLGWGEIPGGTMPDVLQYVKVPYLPFAKCVELAESIELGSIPSDHFCYGPSKSETQPSSCGGDSGGPAVLDAFTKPMQVSLTSYGAKEYKCGGSDNVLSVDTSVSAWRPWIDDTLSLYNLQWQHPPARKNKLLEGRCIEGDTIRTLSTITAGTCCDTCRINSLCKAWTWSRRTQKCYIKKGDGRQTISPICTSGLF
jgi:secreted trypsin-like serine protease